MFLNNMHKVDLDIVVTTYIYVHKKKQQVHWRGGPNMLNQFTILVLAKIREE